VTPADKAIVPGERIAGFVLGERVKDAVADMAAHFDIRVQVHKDVIVDLSTGAGKYATAEGFKVGGSFSDVEAAWGEAPDKNTLEGEGMFDFKASWPDRGIDFAVLAGKIVHVGVFRPE
jgi:hypothetical protein